MSTINPRKPNIVLILSDDQGYWSLGSSGNKEIKTPYLDKIAEEGIRFENFFCTSPVCSPARASIITGRIPSQHGVHDWIKEGNYGKNEIDYLEGQVGITDILSKNGYTCGISGKWHLGASSKPQKSFSHWYVHEKGSSSYYNAPMIRNGKLIHEPGYITDAITDDALSFIDNCNQEDYLFYLSVHYTAPHGPWINEHPEKYVQMYDDCPFDSCPQESVHPDSVNFYSEKDARECLKGYFASITAMDENIGRIIAKLDDLGIREETLIIFISDNGFNCGHHGIWGKGNGTFPVNMYDTSVKVPAIMSYPGFIPEKSVSKELLSQYDIFPTLMDLLNLELPASCNMLPGKSFLPVLLGNPLEEDRGVVIFDEYGPTRMIRTSEWKYIYRFGQGRNELYNVSGDPGEQYNVINNPENTTVVSYLHTMMTEWFSQYVFDQIDGSKHPIIGSGQLDKVNSDNSSPKFVTEKLFSTDPRYDPGIADSKKFQNQKG